MNETQLRDAEYAAMEGRCIELSNELTSLRTRSEALLRAAENMLIENTQSRNVWGDLKEAIAAFKENS